MSANNRYKFVVKYVEECNYTTRVAKGYVIGESFVDITEKISRYYGDKNIEDLYFEWENDEEVIVVEDVEYEEVKDTNYKDWEGPLPVEVY